MFDKRLFAGLSGLALVTGMAASAQAQTAPDNKDQHPGVADIIVTAQFRSQSIQSTPIAITAVNAKMLEARSQTSIVDVANQAPGVSLKPAGAGSGPALQASIRGIGQTDWSFAFEPGVGMYVDDVYYSTLTGSVLELLDLERVEILRGPQGTLSGRNSLGGAIRLYSARPRGDGSGYVSATVGDQGRMQFRAAADIALIKDKAFLRVSGLTNSVDGYVTRYDYRCLHPTATDVPSVISTNNAGCKLGTAGGKDYAAIRASLLLLPAEGLEIRINGDYTRDNSEVQATTQTYAGAPTNPAFAGGAIPSYDSRFLSSNPYVSYATYCDNKNYAGGNPARAYCSPPYNHFRGWGVSGEVKWDLGHAFTLTSITAYRRYTAEFSSDNDGSPFGLENQYYNPTHRQFTQELRLNGSLGKWVDYTVGGFHLDSRANYDGRVDAPVFGLTDFVQADLVKAQSNAGFLHAVLHATDRFNLTGGLRYTEEKKDYTYNRTVYSGAPQVSGVSNNYSGSKWDFRAALDYKLTSAILAYAQFATGFKGGGAIPRPIDTSHVLPGFPYSRFGPESLKSYEVGLKTTLFDRRLRLNMAAFTSDYDGIQQEINNCGNGGPFLFCIAEANVGSARIKGLEAEFNAEPAEGLKIDGSASYTDFRYTRITQPTGVTLGMVAPLTPEWKWSVGVQYEAKLAGLGTLTPRIDGAYQSATYFAAVNLPSNRIGGYTIWNGRVTYRPPVGRWEAAVEVTNLLDKVYFYNIFDIHGSLGVGYSAAQPAPPRRVAATVKYSF